MVYTRIFIVYYWDTVHYIVVYYWDTQSKLLQTLLLVFNGNPQIKEEISQSHENKSNKLVKPVYQ